MNIVNWLKIVENFLQLLLIQKAFFRLFGEHLLQWLFEDLKKKKHFY